jgi:hypothetical protein
VLQGGVGAQCRVVRLHHSGGNLGKKQVIGERENKENSWEINSDCRKCSLSITAAPLFFNKIITNIVLFHYTIPTV